MAQYLGGGTEYDITTHAFTTGPSYAVYGGSYDNVGSAITALQASGPVQYYDPGTGTTTTTPTNEVTLVGANPDAPVLVHNVATPIDPTDAANKAYVDNAVGDATANAVTYDSSAKDQARYRWVPRATSARLPTSRAARRRPMPSTSASSMPASPRPTCIPTPRSPIWGSTSTAYARMPTPAPPRRSPWPACRSRPCPARAWQLQVWGTTMARRPSR